jgi:hypothetical protein
MAYWHMRPGLKIELIVKVLEMDFLEAFLLFVAT